MTELTCRYAGDRDQAIVSYLYDDVDPAERVAFDAHLSTCARCRTEMASLQGVRTALEAWVPPDPVGLLGSQPPVPHRNWWRDIPAWAQVAAALLVLGVAAGIANLDVRYDAAGLRVRTGWSSTPPSDASRPADAPWRAELTAMEQRLRSQLAQPNQSVNIANAGPRASSANVVSSGNPANPELLRRVRTIVDESEQRQQRELALRLAETMRDLNAQRQSDLAKIDRSIGTMQNNTGLEILRTRETINNINNYLVRTSAQRPQ
jgi:hypothetical protein